MTETPFVESILHPSDFTEAGHSAFVHALAIALYRRARFDIFHVVTDENAVEDWSQSPPVRKTLERWGLLEAGSPRSALRAKLAMDIAKVKVRRKDPVKAILDDVRENPVDLIVLATEGREGVPRWLKPSVAEGVVRAGKTMTLFVPPGARGFVSADDGRISLKRVLLPVAGKPSAVDAVNYAARVAVASHEGPVEIVLLNVGSGKDAPWPDLPEFESCTWRKVQREGKVVDQIQEMAEKLSAELIVMPTEGRKGVFGTLRGRVTERVLRRSSCPVLAVPARE